MNTLGQIKPIIGITGTNGKTSSILMAKFILQANGCKPLTADTWKGAANFLRLTKQLQAEAWDCLLVEVPAEALQQKKIAIENFAAGALTNLSLDHLTTCRTPKQYLNTKASFLNGLPQNAKLIINADDPQALALAEEGHVEYITYATSYPNAMLVAKNIRQHGFATQFELTLSAEINTFTQTVISPGSAKVVLPLLGRHNVSNALLAAAIALLCLGDLQAVAKSLSRLPGIRRNLEIITPSPVLAIDDAAHNPAAIQAALTAIESLNHKRTLLLHGIYGRGGHILNQKNARQLSAWLKKYRQNRLFVTSSLYHTKNKYQVRISEEKAFLHELKENGIDFAYYPHLPDAVDSMLKEAKTGDLILFLGGHVLNRARDFFPSGDKKLQANLLIASEFMVPAASPDLQNLSFNPS
ncbi:MAG: hypothetical protein GX197_00380 [Firmicutes bacterium]|nr:hypothetical protein [Bacillota bacterium]